MGTEEQKYGGFFYFMADLQINVTDNLDAFLAKLGALNSALNQVGGSGGSGFQKLDTSVDNVSAKIKQVEQNLNQLSKPKLPTQQTEGFAKALEDAGAHSRTLAMGLSSMGSSAGAAVARVDGLATALLGMQAAVPELLAIAAALAVIFGAFELGKAAVDAASDWQQKMAVLGATVSAQGGNWKNLSKAVQDYADVQEETTRFGRDEVVGALTQLTSAGMDLADAMKVNRVAEDASAATGIGLADVNHALVEAMHGRTQALTQLGIGTKNSIKDGMSFNQVLSAIEKQMGGAAAASADTYAGKLDQLHNTWATLMETVGSAFLPMLTKVVSAVTTFVQNIETKWSEMSAATQQWYQEHKQAIQEIEAVFLALGADIRADLDVVITVLKIAWSYIETEISLFLDIISGNWKQAWADIQKFCGDVWNDILTAFGGFGDDMLIAAKAIAKNIGGVFQGVGASMALAMTGNYAEAAQVAATTVAQTFQGIKFKPLFQDDALDQLFGGSGKTPPANPADPNTGINQMVGGGSGGSGSFSPLDITQATANNAKLADAHKAITQALGTQNAAQGALNSTIDNSITKEGLDAQTNARLLTAYNNAKTALPGLITEIGNEKQSLIDADKAQQTAYANYETATTKLNNLKSAINAAGKETKADKENLKELTDQQKEALDKVNAASRAVATQTSILTGHEAAAKSDTAAIEKFNQQQQEIISGYNSSIQATQQERQDTLATYGKSLSAQIAYWTQRNAYAQQQMQADYAATHAWNAADVKEAEDAYSKMTQLQTQYQEQSIEKEQQYVSTFVNDLVDQNKSLRDTLKDIFSQILQDWTNMIIQMIEKSLLLKSVNNGSGGIAGLFSSLFGGGNTVVGSTAAAGANSNTATADMEKALTGVPGGVKPNSATAMANSNPFETMLSNTSGSTVSLGGAMDVIGLSAALGGGIGNAEGASDGAAAQAVHAENGEIGGALGAATAMLLAGPAGWAAVALMGLGGGLLGGAGGGLIGPHMNETNNPDQFSDNDFAQMVANAQGSAYTQASGNVSEDSTLSSQLNGQTELQYIDAFVTSHPGGQGLTGDQLATWQQAAALTDNGQAVGEHGLSNGNIGLSDSMDNTAPLIAGTDMNWQDLGNKIDSLTSSIQQLNQTTAGASEVFALTNAAPDYNSVSLWDVGSYNPSTDIYTSNQSQQQIAAPTSGGLPSNIRTTQPVVVNVTVQGSVTSEQNLANTISQQVQRNLSLNAFNQSY